MTGHRDLAQQVLDLVDGRAEAEVYVDIGVSSLTRFANSFIHQNVSEEASTVSVRMATDDGRVASSAGTATTSEALARLVDRTLDAAGRQPPDQGWPGFGSATEPVDVDHWDQATADADPVRRAEVVKAFVDVGEGMSAAGYCQTEARHLAYANTSGRFADGRYTTAVIDGIHQTPGAAGSGHMAGASLGDLDAGAAGALAADRAREGRDPFDAKPGEYEVVIAPECVATIALFLGVYGFNAKVHQEGMSFAEIGEAQFDPSITLRDDATDDRALHVGFDVEGTPKRGLDLITRGTTASLLHNRRTAQEAGVPSTGHAAPGAEAFGPFAWNTFVEAGTSSPEGLIAGVERGIYVATFNYCRVLDPKSLVVTGLTRNGTFMIENGAITDPVSNLRFTQSFIDAWGPGNVGGIADDARFADSEFGAAMIHAPSMHLRSWNFTGGADG